MDIERLCDNHTALTVQAFAIDDPHGRELAVVVAKVTWNVGEDGEPSLAVPQRPVRAADVMLTEERWSSVRFPSDRVDGKLGTDVLMVGHAHPPGDGEATSMEVSLRLEASSGLIDKCVRVHGPRLFTEGTMGVVPGPAAPVAVTPLVYEYAEGGVDESDDTDETKIDWANPAGVGVARRRKGLVGTRAFQIETVSGIGPAGFGPIAAHWQPRLGWAGTYDEAWQRERAPVRPRDFDARHHVSSHPDLWSKEPLFGDERVEVIGATPEGTWRFQLPRYAPRFEAVVDGATKELDTHLDTFLIDCDAQVVELTWRAATALPRKTERLERISIRETGALSEAIYDRLSVDLARFNAKLSLSEGA